MLKRYTMNLDAVYVRSSDGEFHLRAKASQEKKSATHYDLLIRKTSDEMAEFLEKLTKGFITPSGCPKTGCHSESCKTCWLDWLMQKAE